MGRLQGSQLEQSRTQSLGLQAFAGQAQAALQSAAVAQDAMQQQLQQLRVEHAAEVEHQKGESDLQMQERKAEQRHNAALEKAFLKLEKESHEMIRCEKQKVRNLQQQLANLEICSQIDYQKALESVSSKP